MPDRPILVAGAGIAGLTLGLALSQRGIATRLLERREVLSEAGAGIQLGPNAMHVLQRLGVCAHLEPSAGAPQSIDVVEGASARVLSRFPLGDHIARRFGAPYLVAHRADLQGALLAAAHTRPDIEIVTGFEVTGWAKDGHDIVVSAPDGRTIRTDALVGADGIWSTVRRTLAPDHALIYSGKMAARTVVPAEIAGERFARQITGVWLAEDAHVVHYPVRAGREIAVVVIIEEPSPREGWGSEITSTSVLARLIRFAPELLTFLGQAKEWHAWSLYDPTPLASWSRDGVCLIGDAAHPILPFFAQGGGMAIEDAETLAALLSKEAAPHAAFERFARLRRDRVIRVQGASRDNGVTFHLAGAMAAARNLVLALAPGSLMMRRYDWLYGWNGDAV
jgi:salicylate hydroxylase